MIDLLIVDDDALYRSLLRQYLESADLKVAEASNAREALAGMEASKPAVVLLDLGLPDKDGLELLEELRRTAPRTRVVVLTARDTARDAVRALQAGASHYLVKTTDLEEVFLVVQRELVRGRGAEFPEREIAFGVSPAARELEEKLNRAAGVPQVPVLVMGETGTGKEVFARELHRRSGLEGPFVAVNCAAIPGELLESELFGHEAGAFTGASARRRGLVELAQGGTLFLDEIGDMPLSLQPKLLRFLDTRTLRRIGGEREIAVNCRIVAATHRDLEGAVEQGAFREDLLYRLAVLRVRIPPLRERPEDVLFLLHHLMPALCRELSCPLPAIPPETEDFLQAYPWPGNVRQLRAACLRALVSADSGALLPEHFQLPDVCPTCLRQRCTCAGETGDEEQAIRDAWRRSGGSIAAASRLLGKPRHWVKYRLQKYGLLRERDSSGLQKGSS